MTLEKISLKTRIKNLYDFDVNPSWERIFIVIGGILLNVLVCYLLGLTNHFGFFILVSVFIQGIMIQELPRKKFIKVILIFSIVTAFALFTAALGSQYTILAVIFFIFWFAVFTIVHVSGFEVSKMGLYSVFTYFFGYLMLSHIHLTSTLTILASLYYGLAGILMVLLGSIPALILNYMEHDPYKREILAELYKPDISFNEILQYPSILLDCDDTKRTHSLINMAIKIYVLNNNVDNLRYSLDEDLEKEFNKFLAEVYRLLNKVHFAIVDGYDQDFELNTGNIIAFQKNLSYRIEKIENKTPNQEYLLKSVKQYSKLFIDLNKVLSDELVVDDIDLEEIKEGYVSSVKNNLNKDNVDLKYSIRFAVAGTISFIADLIMGNASHGITIASQCTLSPDHRNTGQSVALRIGSTFLAIIATFLIALVLIFLKLGVIASVIAVISFVLFYVYKDDYPVAVFFLVSGLMLLKPVASISKTVTTQILATFIALFIVLFANYCILPSKKHYNLTMIISDKVKFSGKHIENMIENKELLKIKDFNLYEINNSFHDAIDTLESVYIVGNDLTSFKEIFNTLDNLTKTLLYVLDTENSDNILDDIIPDFFSDISKVMKNEKEMSDVTNDFTKIEEHIKKLSKSTDEDRILSLKYQHILADLEYLNDVIMKTERNHLFEKYNEEL